MSISKAKNLVIRAWLEEGGVNAWRATVTNVDTKQARSFSRVSELVKHLESEVSGHLETEIGHEGQRSSLVKQKEQR